MSGVGVEEAAAIGAEHLDRDLAGDGAEGRAIACAVDPEGTTLWVVGIRALDPGVNLFEAMAAGTTTGLLWRAELH